jgi:hypothetical protein
VRRTLRRRLRARRGRTDARPRVRPARRVLVQRVVWRPVAG